jgi:nucleotide-binding universal stress UspA family protein
MTQKIFLYIDGSPAAHRAAGWAVERAKEWRSRVYVLYVVDRSAVVAAARRTGRPRRALEGELEEKGWRHLYEIEDDAFEAEVKVSLIMEDGLPLERITELAKSYEADLVVVGYNPKLDLAKLIKQLPATVAVIK